MSGSIPPSKGALKVIARRAMLERGLLPDFSPDVRTQTAAIARASAEPAAADILPKIPEELSTDLMGVLRADHRKKAHQRRLASA